MSGTINTVANQPLAGPLLGSDYFLVYQGAQSPPTRKLPASDIGQLYASLTSANTFTQKQTISSGGIAVTGNSTFTGTVSVSSSFVVSSGGVTVNNGGGVFNNVGGWSSFNFGKQLLVQRTDGNNNPAIAITDKDGTNLWSLANSTGTLLISKMPAYSDNTTPPTIVGSFASTGLSITGTLTSSGKLTVTSGGATVTAGGLTVTAGGATITAGGLTVTAGTTAIGGAMTIAGNITSTVTMTNSLTVQGAFNQIQSGLSGASSGAGQIIVGFSPAFTTLKSITLTSFQTSGLVNWEVTSSSAAVGFNATARDAAGSPVSGAKAYWTATGT